MGIYCCPPAPTSRLALRKGSANGERGGGRDGCYGLGSLLSLDRDWERARCVLVDTEQKVVRALLEGPLKGMWRPGSDACSHSGRGSNWALGYNPPAGGKWDGSSFQPIGGRPVSDEGSVLNRAMKVVAREVARADGSEVDFVVVHSLAGGTGSGLGSRIVENLRRRWTDCCILCASFAPRSEGDGALQNYNTVLTAKWLHTYADGILLFRNGDLFSILEGGYNRGPSSQRCQVSFADVNRYAARCLASVLFPVRSPATTSDPPLSRA